MQADEQLDKDSWELLKLGIYGQPTADEWLTVQLRKGSKVAIDPFVHSKESAQNTEKILEKAGIELKGLEGGENLVDLVWDDRPQMPMAGLRIHPQVPGSSRKEGIVSSQREIASNRDLKHVDRKMDVQELSGRSVGEKLAKIRQVTSDLGADALLVTMLDEVAWVFNVRGSDVPNTPVPLAYGIIHQKYAKLYVENSKLSQEVQSYIFPSARQMC